MESDQEKPTVSSPTCTALLYGFLRVKTATLWHPESPGVKVTVKRSWIGRIIKPEAFATLGETLKNSIEWKAI